MKLEFRDANGEAPSLWRFFEKHLPTSLKAIQVKDGYGVLYGVEVTKADEKRPLTSRLFGTTGFGIATIGLETVELRYPEYFSDFEEIIKKYESERGKEVKFVVWEDN